jgi:DNA (cytosine-5)-methyltransferase 1
MQIIDLFSGIGGFSLAGRWMGWETIQFCEIDKYCQAILGQNFPNVPIHDNIKTLKGEQIKTDPNKPTILVGGFPCQPFSNAGKRKGENDNRFLWPEMLRIIREVQPKYIFGENVPGILSIENGMVNENIQLDLEAEGYNVWAFDVPACAIGAYHQRQRIWYLAYPGSIGLQEFENILLSKGLDKYGRVGVSPRLPDWEQVQSRIFRDDNGVPNRLDRIKALGNAIVPQVAFEFFQMFQLLEENY